MSTDGDDQVLDAYLTPLYSADGTIFAHMTGLEAGSRSRAQPENVIGLTEASGAKKLDCCGGGYVQLERLTTTFFQLFPALT